MAGYCARAIHLVLAEPGLVSLEIISNNSAVCELHTYKNQTTHHVHASTQAGVEDGLVTGNHPLAAALYQAPSVCILPMPRCSRCMHLKSPVMCLP